MEICLKSIYIKKSKKKLIEECCLNFERNGIYLFVGDNGSGKTTFAKYINKEYHQYTSFLEQNNDQIIEDFSVLENINMFQDKKDIIVKYLHQNELEYLLERPAKTLSGGEKRVVSILRMYFSEKPLIIVDEPTNDVDMKNVGLIVKLFEEMAKTKILIVITYDDRFKSYVRKYQIKDTIIEEVDGNDCGLEESSESCDFDYNNLTIRKRSYIMPLYALAILIVLMYAINPFNYNHQKSEEYMSYQEPFYRVFSPLISAEEISMDAVISSKMLTSLYDMKKLYSLIFEEEDLYLNDDDLDVLMDLNLNNLENKIIPLTYYNAEERSVKNYKRIFQEYLTGDNEQDIILFTNTLQDATKSNSILNAIVPRDLSGTDIIMKLDDLGYDVDFQDDSLQIEMTLNFEVYQNILENADLSGYSVVDAIVELNHEETIYDYISKSDLDDYYVLVEGYEAYKIMELAKEFMHKKKIFVGSSIMFILTFLIFTILFIINQKINYNNYKIIYNYGYKKGDIIKYCNKYYLIKESILWSFILAIIFSAMLYYLEISYAIIYVIIYLTLTIGFIMMVKRFYIEKTLGGIYEIKKLYIKKRAV